MRLIKYICVAFLIGLFSEGLAQHDNHSTSTYFFKENKGQWNSIINYKANLADGAMFLENQGITYHFQDKSWIRDGHGDPNAFVPDSIHGHVVKVSFNKSNANPIVSHSRKAPHYENYFIGNDSNKWASHVGIYNQVVYTNMYNEIDFKIYEHQTNMKYDFIVRPGGKVKDIEMEYKGADEMFIENDILYVKTSLTDIIENKPFAYQIINGETITVPCFFKLKKNKVTFDFPDGYDKSQTLIIDPFLVFSTYSGSTADNFGFTATYDTLGFTYAGGTVFGTGYPTTVGAYDRTFASPGTTPVDVGISKYSLNGASLIYSTYIGGNGDDAPHSMVTNGAGDLFIFGSTSSNDFPTSATAYDNTFNGGVNLSFSLGGTGLSYFRGADAFVFRLNTTGTTLVASTYIGGTGNDAINLGGGLNRNYGDEFRGEIIVDAANNCYVATSSNSTNFPIIGGLAARGGSSDGVAFKFNATLSTLTWSTYIGGSGFDAAYGIQQDAAGNTFVVGGSTSTNLSSAQNTNSGGIDGYIAKYSPANALLTSRYIGTAAYDQIYFVQLDITDSVYVFGQSLGAMPVTPGKYNNAGSHQFIQKFNNTINLLNFSTVFGTGGTNIDISPSAFLVNDCGLIYMSGWGGTTNGGGSTTTGLPTTTGAFQTATTGSDFYLMVLDKNAAALNYATFFGGTVSSEHVDGGTSRFDKKGNVYQAVCAGCGGRNDFPTSTGAYSTTNGSSNCNLAVFKFNINEIQASASVPTVTICYPAAAVFGNNSRNGNTYNWDFGDGNTSSAFAPSHTYSTAGTYTVVLTVSDSTGCIKPDTASVTINVFDPASAVTTPDTNICEGTNVQLNATGGTTYTWSPAASLNNAFIANPIATPLVPTTYQVIVTNPCGADTSFVRVGFHSVVTSASNDTTICNGDTAQLFATGGGTYSWGPFTNIINPNSANPRVFPSTTTRYIATITTPEGCPASDTVNVTVIDIPRPTLTANDSICFGDDILLTASGADTYSWSPSKDLSSSTGTSVRLRPDTTVTIFVDYTNQCATLTDSVTVTVVVPQAFSSPDDTICFNEPIEIWASGGVRYRWTPASFVSNPSNDTTSVNPTSPTRFRVVVTDAVGCTDTAFTNISFSPIPFVNAGPDQILNFGESTALNATSSAGTFSWSPNTSLSSTISKTPIAQPANTTRYIANLLDDFGCLVSDTVVIALDGSLYIPNTFSPNGDGINDVFKIEAEDITEFEILIFNRWGELLFESTSTDAEWDGTFNGKECQTDTYVWRIVYSDVNTPGKEVIGHVNLLR